MASCDVNEELGWIENDFSPIHPGSNIYEAINPVEMDKDRKHAAMRKSPETLFADKNRKGNITNLLFFTHHGSKWYNLFCDHYEFYEEKFTNKVAKTLEKVTNEKGEKHLKIHIYNNGTVMLQGKDQTLKDFEKIFMNLKILPEDKKDASSNNNNRITSYSSKKTTKSEADKSHENPGDNTDDPKEDGDSKKKEENRLMGSESSGIQSPRDCQGGEENNVKDEENTNRIPETAEDREHHDKATT